MSTLIAIVTGAYTALAQQTSQTLQGAQYTPTDTRTFASLVLEFVAFINSLVPLILAIAFVVFLYKVFQYFIWGGSSEESRSKGKMLVVWGLLGFFFMVAIWGVVNLFYSGIFE